MNSSWFAVQLKPNKHNIARANLQRQGYEVFLPLQAKEKRRRGKITTTMRPLFPGYMFTRATNNPADWTKMGNTLGVLRLITGPGHTPATMPAGFVEQLVSSCDSGGRFSPKKNINVGDQVALVSGPFAGLVGEISDLSEEGRLGLLLDLMGRSARVNVDCWHIDVISRKAAAARAT